MDIFNNFLLNSQINDLAPKIEDYDTDYDKACYLRTIIINRSTSDGSCNNEHYKILRNYFLKNSNTKELVPIWVKQSGDLSDIWSYIKSNIDRYEPRRKFIKAEFIPLLDYLESINDSKILPYISIDENLKILNSQYIMDTWQKALSRKSDDPEGAITSARTLLESVLKNILEEMNINYKNDGDLSGLYKLVAVELNLSPNEHKEQVFKQILGSCSSIVNGLASLRNEFGDSHGKGQKVYKPSERHAEFAINLAGTMSIFILQTYEFNNNKMK